jgi:hypothetical protein
MSHKQQLSTQTDDLVDALLKRCMATPRYATLAPNQQKNSCQSQNAEAAACIQEGQRIQQKKDNAAACLKTLIFQKHI